MPQPPKGAPSKALQYIGVPGVSAPPYRLPDVLFGVGLDVHPDDPGRFWAYLVKPGQAPPESIAEGTWATCERARLEHLRKRDGAGRWNLPLPTFGGKQLWSDIFIECGWRIQEHLVLGIYRLLDPDDRRKTWGNLPQCRIAYEIQRFEAGQTRRSDHAVVVLHGLLRAKESMRRIAAACWDAGYEVVDANYPSTRRSLDNHAFQLQRLLDNLRPFKTVSFLTHSMGGMVARAMLHRSQPSDPWRRHTNLGRLLMIFPPSQGSSRADRWERNSFAQLVYGPALNEMTTKRAVEVPTPPCRFGIIAGSRDTTVLPHETLLPQAEAFKLLDLHHTFGMQHPDVIRSALHYLEHGNFDLPTPLETEVDEPERFLAPPDQDDAPSPNAPPDAADDDDAPDPSPEPNDPDAPADASASHDDDATASDSAPAP